jgi:uncharacterized protein (TIGR02266 family)
MTMTATQHADTWARAAGYWRRAFQRTPLAVEVSLHSEHNFYAGVTGDISEGGLFVSADDQPPVGMVVDIVLALPGSPVSHSIRGVVRWVRPADVCGTGIEPGFGLAFTEISGDVLAAIHNFAQQRDTILFDA